MLIIENKNVFLTLCYKVDNNISDNVDDESDDAVADRPIVK